MLPLVLSMRSLNRKWKDLQLQSRDSTAPDNLGRRKRCPDAVFCGYDSLDPPRNNNKITRRASPTLCFKFHAYLVQPPCFRRHAQLQQFTTTAVLQEQCVCTARSTWHAFTFYVKANCRHIYAFKAMYRYTVLCTLKNTSCPPPP